MTKPTIPAERLQRFITAMHHVYDFPRLEATATSFAAPPTAAVTWTPPEAPGGHRGRYLWTDAFGVLNFLTLYSATGSESYLHYATVLATKVHDVLGRTRDGTQRLPGATRSNPLGGGLRIGKIDETGPDGDGQYHHYLTLWMFALDRLAVAWASRDGGRGDRGSNAARWHELAVGLMTAVHPAFVHSRDSGAPRLWWKVSTDLTKPLTGSMGNLDPIDGLAVCSMLRAYESRFYRDGMEEGGVLRAEMEDYEKMVAHKVADFSSRDPLDLGMALWSVHRCQGTEDPGRETNGDPGVGHSDDNEEGLQEWAGTLTGKATRDLRDLLDSGYFRHQPERRLAFREFGTVLGMRTALAYERRWLLEADAIMKVWEQARVAPDPRVGGPNGGDLAPITLVMYAAALEPGAFKRGWLDADSVVNGDG